MNDQKNITNESIDHGPMSAAQVVIVCIGFILNCIDGVDVISISVAAPAISQSWGITSVEIGYILSAALFGMMFGALGLAPMSDQYGRRNIVLLAIFMTGASMIATGFIEKSVPLMIAARFMCGVGVGAIFASAATIGSEFTPEKYKNFTVAMIISGYPFGAMIVGPIAAVILPAYGWEMLFILAGIATMIIFLLCWMLLPESVQYLQTSALPDQEKIKRINNILNRISKDPISETTLLENSSGTVPPKVIRVSELLGSSLLTTTLKMWLIFIMGFMTIYFLVTWIPLLFVNAGYTMTEGIYALTLNNLGAMIGITILGMITTRYKLALPVAAFFAITGMIMFYFSYSQPANLTTMYAMMFIIGIFNNGAISSTYAVAARVYRTFIRATGIGWAAGLGRTGAIAAPIVAGYLIDMNFGMYALFAVFAVPVLIAAVLMATFKV